VADQTSRSHNEEAPLPPASGLDVRTEELRIETTLVPGTLYIARRVDEVPHDQPLTRRTEHAHVEHVHPHEPDSGKIETLPDGSLSIPVLEEHIVVTKELRVRERIIVRKAVITEHTQVTDTIRRERVELEVVEADDGRRPRRDLSPETSRPDGA